MIVHCNRSLEETKALSQQLGRQALIDQGDVADKTHVEQMVAQIQERFGRLDILINNAGSMVERSRLEDFNQDLWDRIMNVNLKSVYLVTKAAVPWLKKQEKGKVINLTSVASRNGGGSGAL